MCLNKNKNHHGSVFCEKRFCCLNGRPRTPENPAQNPQEPPPPVQPRQSADNQDYEARLRRLEQAAETDDRRTDNSRRDRDGVENPTQPQRPDRDRDNIPDDEDPHPDDPYNKHKWLKAAGIGTAGAVTLPIMAHMLTAGTLPHLLTVAGSAGLGWYLGKESKLSFVNRYVGATAGAVAPFVAPSLISGTSNLISSLSPAFFAANPWLTPILTGTALGASLGLVQGEPSSIIKRGAIGAGLGLALPHLANYLGITGMSLTPGIAPIVSGAGLTAAGVGASLYGLGKLDQKMWGGGSTNTITTMLSAARLPVSLGYRLHQLGWGKSDNQDTAAKVLRGFGGYASVIPGLIGYRLGYRGLHKKMLQPFFNGFGKTADWTYHNTTGLLGLPLVFLGRNTSTYSDRTPIVKGAANLVKKVSPVHWAFGLGGWLAGEGSVTDILKKDGGVSAASESSSQEIITPSDNGKEKPEPAPAPAPTPAPVPNPTPNPVPRPTPPPRPAPPPPNPSSDQTQFQSTTAA